MKVRVSGFYSCFPHALTCVKVLLFSSGCVPSLTPLNIFARHRHDKHTSTITLSLDGYSSSASKSQEPLSRTDHFEIQSPINEALSAASPPTSSSVVSKVGLPVLATVGEAGLESAESLNHFAPSPNGAHVVEPVPEPEKEELGPCPKDDKVETREDDEKEQLPAGWKAYWSKTKSRCSFVLFWFHARYHSHLCSGVHSCCAKAKMDLQGLTHALITYTDHTIGTWRLEKQFGNCPRMTLQIE